MTLVLGAAKVQHEATATFNPEDKSNEETMSTAPRPSRPDRPTGLSDRTGRDDEVLLVGTAEPEPKVRTGGCECDDTRYEVIGDPDDPHLCSCRHETRISGGPAVLWVGFRRDSLRWVGPGGEPTWYASWPSPNYWGCPVLR